MADSDADTAGTSGAWRTLAEAAVALGLSERTIRRRIDADRIQARQEDGRLLIRLPALADQVADSPPAAPAHGGRPATGPASDGHVADAAGGLPADGRPAAGELVQLLREQIERASRAEQAATLWQERARVLEAELEHALALPPHEQPEPRRRWWQRWQ